MINLDALRAKLIAAGLECSEIEHDTDCNGVPWLSFTAETDIFSITVYDDRAILITSEQDLIPHDAREWDAIDIVRSYVCGNRS